MGVATFTVASLRAQVRGSQVPAKSESSGWEKAGACSVWQDPGGRQRPTGCYRVAAVLHARSSAAAAPVDGLIAERYHYSLSALLSAFNTMLQPLVAERVRSRFSSLELAAGERVSSDNKAYVDRVHALCTRRFKPSFKTNWGCSSQGLACGHRVPCRFHAQPLWLRTAVLFMPPGCRREVADPDQWDLAALSNVVANCNLFDAAERGAGRAIRDWRNRLSHPGMPIRFLDGYAVLLRAVTDLEPTNAALIERVEQLSRDASATLPANTMFDEIERSAHATAHLTGAQFAFVRDHLFGYNASETWANCGWLCAAPAGSGKSVIAVFAACAWYVDAEKPVLHLSHSSLLQQRACREVVCRLHGGHSRSTALLDVEGAPRRCRDSGNMDPGRRGSRSPYRHRRCCVAHVRAR